MTTNPTLHPGRKLFSGEELSAFVNAAAANGVTGPTGAASTVTGPTGPTGAASTVTGPTGPASVTGPTTPASAGATGTTGTVVWDAGFIYVCVATNTWKRIAIATW